MIDVEKLIDSLLLVEHARYAHRVASLQESPVGKIIGTVQTHAEVNGLGVVLKVDGIVDVLNLDFAVNIEALNYRINKVFCRFSPSTCGSGR